MSNIIAWPRKPKQDCTPDEAMLWLASFFWARHQAGRRLTPTQAEQLHDIIDCLVEPEHADAS